MLKKDVSLALQGKIEEQLRILCLEKIQRVQEQQALINVLLKKKHQYEHDIAVRDSEIKLNQELLQIEKDHYEAFSERNKKALADVSREREVLILERDSLVRTIKEKETTIRKLGDNEARLNDYKIRAAAFSVEPQRSIDIEIEKCNRYRFQLAEYENQILALQKKQLITINCKN